jgi:glycosyltransferase involved in cell wall biosynthesis
MAAPQGYFQNVNQDLLSRIPLTAKTVLEVGCGSGALGAAYKYRNPSVRYLGMEAMPEPAAQARQVLDEVICGDVEDLSHGFDCLSEVDCLVYGDVLEHLKDPWKCLERQVPLLSKDGVLLACIPNVQHWSVIANLLTGEWPLEDQGIFDRTHLRWFTQASIETTMQDLGLHIHQIIPRVFGVEKAKQFALQLAPALQNLGIDLQTAFSGMAPLQYVVTVGRQPRKSLRLHGHSNINPPSMGEVRILQPFRALATIPEVGWKYSKKSITFDEFDVKSQRKVFVWQRPLFTKSNEDCAAIRTLIKNGYVVVVDWDDDPRFWPAISETDFLTFQIVHAVQVSTPEIAEVIKPYNPNVRVFPNALEVMPQERNVVATKNHLKLFFGALNRENDWLPLIETLNDVFRADPVFWSISVVHDRRFYDSIDLPESKKSFTSLCDYRQYLDVMSQCDIALMPLSDTPFNRMKSDLKAIEAGAHGLALLASNIVYSKSIADGVTGAIFEDPDQMKMHLQSWRKDPSQVSRLGLAAREWVSSNRLAAHQVGDRYAWYQSLCDRKELLNAQLMGRVPELAE